MKLTQSQRADLLARFFISKSTAALSVRDKLLDAKEMLEAYEVELASWAEPPPAVYGMGAQQMSDGFRSAEPVPLTDKQVKALGKLPDLVGHIRNPEGIDFSKYLIPAGYTVASEEDCKEAGGCTPAGWCQFSGLGWYKFKTNYTKLHDDWTYIRPLRDGER